MTRRNANPRLRGALPGALFALLTLFLVQTAGATPPHAGKKHRAKKTAVSVRRTRPVASGVRAVIDPVTGRLTRPTVDDAHPGEVKAQVVTTPDDRPDVAVEKNPKGGEMARLDDRYQEYEVAKVGPDGKLVHDCVHGPAAASAYRKEAAKPAPAREVR
jgi:hypothetical protein